MACRMGLPHPCLSSPSESLVVAKSSLTVARRVDVVGRWNAAKSNLTFARRTA